MFCYLIDLFKLRIYFKIFKQRFHLLSLLLEFGLHPSKNTLLICRKITPFCVHLTGLIFLGKLLWLSPEKLGMLKYTCLFRFLDFVSGWFLAFFCCFILCLFLVVYVGFIEVMR